MKSDTQRCHSAYTHQVVCICNPRTRKRARDSENTLDKEMKMRPVKRYGVNKRHSANKFKAQTRRTDKRNIAGPMRGGIRL